METPITVKELMTILGGMPPDAIVLYEKYSDTAALTADDVKLIPKEGIEKSRYGDKKYRERIICRHGHYMLAEEGWFEKGDVHPNVDAVIFPGN